jgi:hypothetical protein
MMPGKSHYYRCPVCGNFLRNYNLRSYSTFGASVYSDAYVDSFYEMPPDLTKCKKCNTIFWLSEFDLKDIFETNITMSSDSTDDEDSWLNNWFNDIRYYFVNIETGIAVSDSNYYTPDELLKIDSAQFLSIKDYFRAIDEGLADDDKIEIYIRILIWREYNNRVRQNKKQFIGVKDKKMWRNNCTELIKRLNYKKLNERMMIAELKRNLGDFAGCIETINSIRDPKFQWAKEQIIKECEKENTLVFRLIQKE